MPAPSRTESSTSTDSSDGPPLELRLPPGSIVPGGERPISLESIERRTKDIGRELFDRMGRGPRPWQRAWWENLFIGATLDDPLVRVQLFRFIDALPALHTER